LIPEVGAPPVQESKAESGIDDWLNAPLPADDASLADAARASSENAAPAVAPKTSAEPIPPTFAFEPPSGADLLDGTGAGHAEVIMFAPKPRDGGGTGPPIPPAEAVSDALLDQIPHPGLAELSKLELGSLEARSKWAPGWASGRASSPEGEENPANERSPDPAVPGSSPVVEGAAMVAPLGDGAATLAPADGAAMVAPVAELAASDAVVDEATGKIPYPDTAQRARVGRWLALGIVLLLGATAVVKVRGLDQRRSPPAVSPAPPAIPAQPAVSSAQPTVSPAPPTVPAQPAVSSHTQPEAKVAVATPIARPEVRREPSAAVPSKEAPPEASDPTPMPPTAASGSASSSARSVGEASSVPVADAPPSREKDFSRHLRLAKRASDREHFRLATSEFRKALQLQPQSIDAKAGLGIALVRSDPRASGYVEALTLLEESLVTRRDDAQAWLSLGMAYQFTRRDADAVRAYKEFLLLEPRGSASNEVRAMLKQLVP
jgi:hypothetical protein